MMEKETKYLISLSSFSPFVGFRLKLLYDFFQNFEEIWNADRFTLKGLGLEEKLINSFANHKKSYSFEEFLTELKKENIKIVTFKDKNYPNNIRGLSDAPLLLYYKGELKRADDNAIAIVGSRNMSEYGKVMAEDFTDYLSKKDITIVSGLALGIDAVSHKKALQNAKRTIAVLANGLKFVYPKSNASIANEILDRNLGCLVTEYPPLTKPEKYYFPLRNRIISGLSKAVLVIEGSRRSGTIHTAMHALNQGKTIFAVPGRISDENSGAPNFLIEQGATIVDKPQDVLNYLVT